MKRRVLLKLLLPIAAAAASLDLRSAWAAAESFDDLLVKIEEDPDAFFEARAYAEADLHEFVYINETIGNALEPQKNIARARSYRNIGTRATDLIIMSEITSYEVYEAKYQNPIWPGQNSGITLGVGFDMGYTTPVSFKEDWEPLLAPSDYSLLTKVIGIKGTQAQAALGSVSSVTIDYGTAEQQFKTRALPCYIAETEHAFANTDKLPKDCMGALVSLVYNRGSASHIKGNDPDDRRKEIRAIKDHMKNEKFDLIPAEIKSMKRLWKGVHGARGLLVRRDAEAALFAEGLLG